MHISHLLHFIAFIQHEREIRNMLKEKELNFRRAKELGFLESCNCCFTDDLIPEDCFICRNGCTFCRECIRKAAEIAYSEGKTEYVCLADCGSDFSLATLQVYQYNMVLNPKTFTNLCHRIQMQEINSAGLPGLEHCPLCSDFAMIPAADDQIFHCEMCNKDSCRKCKHAAHVPLRCNEIEYDEDVKMRTFIEDKMTQALIR
ncbi:ubiquitin conjugating enzyme 7 interacting protein-related [Holotrichia oblita]|uniref:Ubiquitin conjugating enzyme 7 interacting protein-related n=1 Tax=Holotrichia oblita TaxID=644536 RepID=A0ACB9TWA4_HOLOL|nr:ubiquitin conjugating enzyme 7 interacting protein-related [Holotrichia oblita]